MPVKQVCLLCLQTFNEGKGTNYVSLTLNDKLNDNFICFLQQHLQIPPSSLQLLHHSKSPSSLQLFCNECKVVINGLCTMYKELLDIQNKLATKLGKLEEIIGHSFGGHGGGEKGENILISSITNQLKRYQKKIGNRQVFELRILISHYCKLESLKHLSILNEKEQSSPKAKLPDPPKITPTRVTRQVTKKTTRQAPSPSPSSPITTEDNITIKEEVPEQEDEDNEGSNYLEDDADHQNDDNSSDGTDNPNDQDNDYSDKEQDKPSSEDSDDASLNQSSEDNSDDDDDWNTSSKRRRSNGPGRPPKTSTSTTARKRGQRPSTYKKSQDQRKSHRRLVADKLNLYPDTIWSCDYCPSTLKSGNSLLTHLTYRHERSTTSRTFPCYLCSRSFGFAQTRSIHLKLYHWKDQPLTYTCSPPSSLETPWTCGAPSFEDPESLLTHLQTHHPTQPLHLCTICQWPFLSPNTRLLHELLHTPLPPGGLGYPCPMSGCTHYAGHTKHLIRHYSAKHDINEESFRCKICEKGFSNQATLNSHQRLHTIQEKLGKGDLSQDFKCGKCGKWHGSGKSLEMHVNRKHTLQKCEECGVEKYYDAFRKHLWVKHGKGRGRVHICEKCGKECGTRYVLRKHMEMKHHPEGRNRMGEWVCSECGKSYHGRVALQVHGILKHMEREERDKLPVEVGKGRWKSKCLKCGRIFKSESDVLAHLYFMQKSCEGRMMEGEGREEKGEGGKEGEMGEVKGWLEGKDGEGSFGEGNDLG